MVCECVGGSVCVCVGMCTRMRVYHDCVPYVGISYCCCGGVL